MLVTAGNTPRTEDTEPLEWTTQWSEGGTESISNNKYCVSFFFFFFFTSVGNVCARGFFFSVRFTWPAAFFFRGMQCGGRGCLYFSFLSDCCCSENIPSFELVLLCSDRRMLQEAPIPLLYDGWYFQATTLSTFPSSLADVINPVFFFNSLIQISFVGRNVSLYNVRFLLIGLRVEYPVAHLTLSHKNVLRKSPRMIHLIKWSLSARLATALTLKNDKSASLSWPNVQEKVMAVPYGGLCAKRSVGLNLPLIG